jgi:hypothetical protein
VLDGFRSLPDREKAMPAMFGLLERFPDAELGTPGPLVHEFESMGGHDAVLAESLGKQPTVLTVWMVNRILNVTKDRAQQAHWLRQLRAALEHPLAAEHIRASAASFIEHQERRRP